MVRIPVHDYKVKEQSPRPFSFLIPTANSGVFPTTFKFNNSIERFTELDVSDYTHSFSFFYNQRTKIGISQENTQGGEQESATQLTAVLCQQNLRQRQILLETPCDSKHSALPAKKAHWRPEFWWFVDVAGCVLSLQSLRGAGMSLKSATTNHTVRSPGMTQAFW